MSDDPTTWQRVHRDEVAAFTHRCMEAAGAKALHAADLASLLVAADYRGHYSHGTNRLEMYVRDIQSGTTAKDTEPTVLKQTVATAWVDGNNALGPAVGRYCIDLAITKAKASGIGWVTTKGSNHYGIAGWYTMRAAEHGLIGICMTNTSPLVVPTRAKTKSLGTNPISVAAPSAGGDSFVLDMATSTVSIGKVEMADRVGKELPRGWGCDGQGKETHNPKTVLDEGGLLPLGGVEETGGYKGYGLAMMVELFCGILGGAQYGPNIRHWKTTSGEANLGQCFVALDPYAFAPGFHDRLKDLIDTCRGLEQGPGEPEVLVPGDPEKIHMKKCDELGGIPYHPNQLAHLDELAQSLNVKPITRLS